MGDYLDAFIEGYRSYGQYLWAELTNPGWGNYFYWLTGLSLFFFLLELIRPWHRTQRRPFRKGFWLDLFYMYFNFFLFSLIIFNAASNVVVELFNDLLNGVFGVRNLVAIEIGSWALWGQLLTLFLFRDLIHWGVHNLLHRVPFLWEFHKVHHSAKTMGFATHLRFHWMENVVYRVLEYIPLAMIGFGIDDFLLVHIVALAIGHWNHSDLDVSIGPLGYIFNNPRMHVWHHAKDLPPDRPYGMNFGLSLALWDYLFGTAHVPYNGKDIELGFPGDEKFPRDFVRQNLHGIVRKEEEGGEE